MYIIIGCVSVVVFVLVVLYFSMKIRRTSRIMRTSGHVGTEMLLDHQEDANHWYGTNGESFVLR